MSSTKQNKIENDLRDGFTQDYVAKKYGVDLKWLDEWWQTNKASRKMDRLVSQLRISPSMEPEPKNK